jgi:hypothetical protein
VRALAPIRSLTYSFRVVARLVEIRIFTQLATVATAMAATITVNDVHVSISGAHSTGFPPLMKTT